MIRCKECGSLMDLSHLGPGDGWVEEGMVVPEGSQLGCLSASNRHKQHNHGWLVVNGRVEPVGSMLTEVEYHTRMAARARNISEEA